MADRRRKKTDIEEAKRSGQKALEDAKAGKLQRVESENEVRGFAEIPYLQGGNSNFGDTSPSVAIDTPSLPTVQQIAELSKQLQEQNASRNAQRRAERDRLASTPAQSQSESVPMGTSMAGYGPDVNSGTLDRRGTLSENGQKEVNKLNKRIESLRKTPMTGDAAIDEVTQSNNQSAIADLQRQIDSIYETDNSERSANVDRYLDSNRKLSKYEKNEANAIFEEYLNNNPKAKELYNTNDAAMSSLLAQRFTPDEAEEYAKMITLKNKISRGQSAGLHATESMPFVKGLADKSTEKYGERIGRDLSDYDYSSQLEQTQTQNPLASMGGNMAYQLGSYAAFAPLLEGIPVVGKAAEKVGGLFKNPAVGEAAANIVRGQAADTILDTLPNEVLPDIMEGNWRDLPKDILLNQAGNLAFNLGGEAVGALANRVIPYLRNADEVADAVKQNEIDPATLAKQNEIDVNAKVDNVNQAVDEINDLAEQIPQTNMNSANDLAGRYASTIDDINAYWGMEPYNTSSLIRRMADDVANGRSLSEYIDELEENIDDISDEGLKATIQSLIDELKNAEVSSKTIPSNVSRTVGTSVDRIGEAISQNDFRPITFTDGAGDTYIISKSTRPGEKWQLSQVDKTGDALGHTAFKTDEDMLETLTRMDEDGAVKNLDLNGSKETIFTSPTVTIREMLDDPDSYSVEDFDRAIMTFDHNADTDGMTRDDYLDFMSEKIEEDPEFGNVSVRVPRQQPASSTVTPPGVNTADEVAETLENTGKSVGENADEITNADVNAPNEPPVDTPEITSGDVNSPDKNLSKVYTNTLTKNQVVDMANEVDRMNAEYNVHHASDVLDAAKTRYLDNAEGWEKAYASGKEPIQSDVDVSTAIMLLKDKAAKIDDLIKQNADPTEIERLTNEKNLLALKLRMAGTEKGQAIKAFDYFNGTAEGAVINAQRMFDREAKKWAKRNPKQAKQLDEFSEDLLKVFRQMNPKTGEKIVKEAPTHDQLLKQIENTLDLKIKDKGVRSSFTPEDIDYIANMIENNASIKELTAMMQTRIANGTWDIPSDVVNKVNNIFAEARNYNPNSKKRVDLETEAFWELANSSNTRASLADKFEAWRYLAMLGNPKTHVRNMIGNVLFGGVTRASDSLAAVIEGAADKTSKAFRNGKGIDRTKAILTPKDADLLKATKQDALDNAYRQLSGSKWNDSKGVQRAINDQREVFSSKLIRKYNDLNNRALSGEDTMAMKSKYQTSLAGYLKAHGIDQKIFDDEKLYYDLLDKQKNELLSADETTLLDFLKDRVEGLNKAREYAIGRAEYAAFHEDNAVADFLSEMSRKARTSEHGSLRAMGMMGEGILPFKKTPANILRSGFEYSPLNIIQDVVRANNIRKGTGSAAELIESMSKTLTGSAMVGMGAWMYDKGILNMSDEDTKWQDNLEGRQNYSISFPVGNDTYTATIDFAAPSVMPIFLGAQIKKMWDANLENKPESFWEYLSEGLQAGSKLISPIAETSMLSGISDTLDSLSSDNKLDALANLALNTTLGYFSQGIPTVLGQGARTIDNTRRSTYSEQNNALARSLDKKAEKIQNKIPFLSMLNQPYVDAYGRTQENSPFETGNSVIDFLGNAAYQAISPSYIQKVEPEDADTSAWEAYNNSDSPNKNVFAGLNTSKKIGDKRLSEEDYTTYATVRGEANLALRNALANNEEFNTLSPNVQSEVLAAADNFADDVGEMAVNPEMELTNTWHKVYENTEGTEADKINAVVEDILAEHNKYGIGKDAYKSLVDAGEDMSVYEGYGDSLAELGLNDNAGNRDAWKQGGAEGLQAIADYNNAFTDAGMDTVYTSKSAVQAYESGDLDTYKEYRAYIKENDIRDSEKQWDDFKRNSGKTNEITTLDPAYQPQGQRDANGKLVPIYNENSNSDVLSQIKSSSIKVNSPDAAYAKASAVFPGLTASEFLRTWSAIDADGSGRHKKDEWTSYLNSMGYDEDEAAALLRAYYPNNYKPLKYSNGKWSK